MDNSNQAYQQFLQQLQDQSLPISVYLKSGIQLRGKLLGFDDDVLLLNVKDGKYQRQIVYHHAISTICEQINANAQQEDLITEKLKAALA